MGTALKYLRELLEKTGLELDRRTATSLLILFFLLILLPVGLLLIKNQLVFFPKAIGETIQLADGGCIKLNKDNKKVVDCPTVPIKLINPFFNVVVASIAPSAGTPAPVESPSAASSSNPIQSPSATSTTISTPSPTSTPTSTPANCATTVNSGAELQTAISCYRNSGNGGRITLPAGTFEVDKKISVPSNVIIAGAGMNATVIRMSANFGKKTSSAGSGDDALMANDSSHGQENIVLRDFTLQGDGFRSGNSCCYGLKLQNISNSFVVNVAVNNFGIDGIYMGIRPNKPGTNRVRITGCSVNNNGRAGIGLVDGTDDVIDHCQLSGNNANELVAAINLEPDRGDTVSNVHIFSNNITNNHNNGIQITQNTNDPGGLVLNNFVCDNSFGGNAGTDFDDQGFQTSTSNCSDGGLNPPSAKRPSAIASLFNSLIKNVFAQDTGDDNFTGTSGDDSNDQFTIGSTAPVPSGSAAGAGNTNGGVLKYKLAESQAGLDQAQWKEFGFIPGQSHLADNKTGFIKNVFAQDTGDDNFTGTSGDDSNDQFTTGSSNPLPSGSNNSGPVSSGTPTFSIGKQFLLTEFQLADTTPGPKQIWVQFMHPDGTIRVDHMTFDLVEKVPQITGLSCNLDIAKQNLKITVDGNYFGDNVGKITIVSPSGSADVLGWNKNQISASLKNSGSPATQGQRFQIKVVRTDGFESPVATCAVDKSLVSLGARLFCREPGKFDASNVVVTILYNSDEATGSPKLSKVDETVSISQSGEISNLKTQLQVGKNYVMSIKAPNSIRKNAVFVASEGTTQITRPDGTPFILPIGDIAPVINPDGSINSLDRAELIRQWKVLGTGDSKMIGDFNRDGKVNSIDWACMQYDFGSADDPLPVEVPGSSANTIHIPIQASGSGTIKIPITSPSPVASSSL